MLLPAPPKRLAIPEISPPRPAILPSPPLSALEMPPDAVCLSTLLQTLLGCELVLLLLDGDPKLIPVGTAFAVSDEFRISDGAEGFTVSSVPGCESASKLEGVNRRSMLCPSTLGLASRLNLPDKLLLRFATLFLHSPCLF